MFAFLSFPFLLFRHSQKKPGMAGKQFSQMGLVLNHSKKKSNRDRDR